MLVPRQLADVTHSCVMRNMYNAVLCSDLLLKLMTTNPYFVELRGKESSLKSHSAILRTSLRLQNLKFHGRIYESPPCDYVLSDLNPVRF